jgi:hypothetical protein
MLPKICLGICLLMAGTTFWSGVRQTSALHLGAENQNNFWGRNNTNPSGRYVGGVWIPSSSRASYGNFSGGGSGLGK